tara:strand:+ start:1590 stop:3203 length:1614 start_codon:yes stop_codon:yes gene_type:complete
MREVGDALVRGIISREDSALLPTGFVADAKNVRMDDGTATTRNGYVQKVSLGVSVFSSHYFGGMGSGLDNNAALFETRAMTLWDGATPTSIRYDQNLLLAENRNGLLTEAGNSLVQEASVFVSLGSFPSSDEGLQFVNKEILFKGLGEILPVSLTFHLGGPAQTWAGDTADDFIVDNGIPETDYGIVVGDRLAIQSNKDEISFSDLANPSNFDVLNKFTFGKGDGDDVVGMAPVPENAAIVFKKRSTWAISDLELLPNAAMTQVSGNIGCVSRHTIQNIGSAIFFLSDKGVYAFDVGVDASNTRGVLTQFDLRSEPLSKPINNQILAEDMVEARTSAKSVYFNNRYYLAFKNGTGTKVYIFNSELQAWESRDEYPFLIKDFVRATPINETKERLYAATNDGKLILLEEGLLEDLGEILPVSLSFYLAPAKIAWTVNTRHYGGDNLNVESFRRGGFAGETLESSVGLTVSLYARDPDSTSSFTPSIPSTANENFLTRFSLRKRGQSLQYKFTGSGMMKLRGMRAELTDDSNNLTTKYE